MNESLFSPHVEKILATFYLINLFFPHKFRVYISIATKVGIVR